MVTFVLGELAEVITRRPGATLVGCLAAIALAAALALGAASRLPVLGSLSAASSDAANGSIGMVLVLRGEQPVDSDVYSTALDVIESAVTSDPQVDSVRRGAVGADGQTTALGVVFAAGSALDRERAATRLAVGIDPGPLELLAGGEAPAAVQARDSGEDELAGVGLLAIAAIGVLVIAVAGVRFGFIAAIAALAGAIGGVAILRLL